MFTALAGFLQARSQNGLWLLRIDDLDAPRTFPGAADGILQTLDALGLQWDGAVAYQSKHLPLYREALDLLDSKGLLYPCTCSRKSLGEAQPVRQENSSAPETGPRPYPGFCALRKQNPDLPHALRVKARDTISFIDHLQGPLSYSLPDTTGDFILRRKDGIIAYHLATVIDDYHAQITETLRGIDLLDSTACQIHLKNLLGMPVGDYLHIPVLVDAQGVKYSKQTGATAVDSGNPAQLLLQLLALLKQNPPLELSDASAMEILRWGVAHWDIDQLRNIAAIRYP
ncbi:tRNA glutamyl-Q(34) synthetase GluQRS [Candidatus Methylospira mobilis]|nr:tRNA glutamyl-Q(34) synthetase GluQRS [Candidatus Methylospira mobilis]WNV04889.1 tRNA glutamyl-Q(34) synthetase GluQRS [Candidatus Methylospira mobilis]